MTIQLHHHIDVALSRRQGLRRRDFLRAIPAAGLAAGALGWSDRMSLEAAELKKRGMACILLWMQGGPSQFETFSPEPGHANGGETKAIKTNVSGVQISENFPELAKLTDQLAIIRSMTGREGSHLRASYLLHTGYLPTASVKYPTLGANVAHRLAAPGGELPSFVRIGRRFQNVGGGGLLGVEYDPFGMTDATRTPDNTVPTTDRDRFRRRQRLLGSLEEEFAAAEGKQEVADHRKLYDKASRMILSSQMKAFDLGAEPKKMRDAYGSGQFASGCLLARRLIEAGVTFVEVSEGNWDTHQDNFNRSRDLAARVDGPFAQLLRDLKQRGMLDSTLVIWMGEFGRTPRINPRTGRDHYPRAFNVALAGGGIQGGQVIGRTDPGGVAVADRPVTVPDLFQSFCRSLKIDPDQENMSSIGRPIKIVEEGEVVKELFG